MLEPGLVLQRRYTIISHIGKGGMGTVYLAKDQNLGVTVAVKQNCFDEQRLIEAFKREARLLAGLRHSVLPQVKDYFIDNTGQYLVMEYIPGPDLWATLEERRFNMPPAGAPKPLDVDNVVRWAEQLLDALDYLHTRSEPIVHRDIKPQNLKIAERNQVILLDFGLAKGKPLWMTRVTTTGSLYGYTPNYAPLEQIQGLGTDPRSDLYALGATLYHLITGLPPVDAATRADAFLGGEPDPLRPANEVNSKVPQGIAQVLMKAMEPHRNNRPASAAEILEMLRTAKQSTVVDWQTRQERERLAEMLRQEKQAWPTTEIEIHERQEEERRRLAQAAQQEKQERKEREEALERQRQEEQERKAKEDAERKQREEQERKAKEEADQRRREEEEQKAREEAERVRLEQEESQRTAREAEARRQEEEVERLRLEREKAELEATETEARRQRAEIEKRALEEAERKEREEQELAARNWAEEHLRQEEDERRAREEEESLRLEKERKVRQDAERLGHLMEQERKALEDAAEEERQEGPSAEPLSFVPRKRTVVGVVVLLLLVFSIWFAVRLPNRSQPTGSQAEAAMNTRAEVIPSYRPEVNKNIITARGAVDNISDEPLKNLYVEISLQSGGHASTETRKVPVTPNPLPPSQRGMFEFQYDGKRDTGFAGYKIIRLLSDETEVKFRTPKQK